MKREFNKRTLNDKKLFGDVLRETLADAGKKLVGIGCSLVFGALCVALVQDKRELNRNKKQQNNK